MEGMLCLIEVKGTACFFPAMFFVRLGGKIRGYSFGVVG